MQKCYTVKIRGQNKRCHIKKANQTLHLIVANVASTAFTEVIRKFLVIFANFADIRDWRSIFSFI